MARKKTEDIELFFQHDINPATRTLYLGGEEINEMSSENLIKGLHLLESFSTEVDINILLNNPGGDVTQAFAIFDAIRMCKSRVIISVLGQASSAASFILQAGDVRRMTSNSKLMIHTGTVEFGESHPRVIKSWLKRMDTEDDLILRIFLEKIKKTHPLMTIPKLRKMTEFDLVLSAQDALSFNLVDEVIDV